MKGTKQIISVEQTLQIMIDNQPVERVELYWENGRELKQIRCYGTTLYREYGPGTELFSNVLTNLVNNLQFNLNSHDLL